MTQTARFRIVLGTAPEELSDEVLRLQHRCYSAEAELIGDDRIPPLHEDLEALRAKPLIWALAHTAGGESDGEVVGAIAWTRSVTELDIDRLMVDSSVGRQGIGSELVGAAVLAAGQHTVRVTTGSDNAPALALYRKLGFVRVGEHVVLDGLRITSLRRDHPAQDVAST
jgi:ribosomal protein S18 acetylase RimI-like enzyme